MFQPNMQTNTPHCGNEDTPHPIGTDTIEDHHRLNNEQRTLEVPNSKTAALTQQNQKLSEEVMRLHEQISILEQVM
jgi:cell division protein FtsB